MINLKRQWDKHHSKAFLWIATKEESVKLPPLEEVAEVLARQGQSLEHDLMARIKSLYDEGGKTQVPNILIGAPWSQRQRGWHDRPGDRLA